MSKMLAAVFEEVGELNLKEVDVPVIENENQILIEVEAVSICGTDVHIVSVPPGYEATPGTILGHELVGHVIEKGKAVAHLEVGERVVVNPNDYCGVCQYCRKNLPNECEHIVPLGIDYNGAFAKYCLVSGKVAYQISEDVKAAAAACAEPLACALNGFHKISIVPGESAVIIGCGPIGLMIAMLAKASGIGKLYLLETSEYRREFAKKLDLGEVIDARNQKAKEIILNETQIGTDYVFDVTGSQMLQSIELVRKGGEIVLFGVNQKSVSEIPQCNITMKEITIHGTWLANATFPEAIKVLEEKKIDVEKLVTDILPLAQVKEGITKLADGKALKVIIEP